jgi:hypothetical protein
MASLTVYPQVSAKDIQESMGKYFNTDDTWTMVTPNDGVVSVVREDGSYILRIRRNAISKELTDLAVQCYLQVGKQVSSNRGHAAGMVTRGRSHDSFEKGRDANSGIMGYMDNTNLRRPCRLTQFSQKHFQQYERGLPFIHKINECFQELTPEHYKLQKEQASRSSFHIADTAFSTVTVNYNFRTALHQDSGDFKDGFGNLVVCQTDISGGHVLFPRYKLAVVLNTGDFLAMDVHEPHCNSPITVTSADGYRLSFICFLREKMHECETVNKQIAMMNGGQKTAEDWITDIFQAVGELVPPKEVTGQGKHGHTWWERKGTRFTVAYKHKRYTLYDHLMKNKIHELAPSWEYAMKLRTI